MNTYTASLPHTGAIRAALYRFEQDMMRNGGSMAQDRDMLKALASAFCAEVQAMVYICGGDGSYIEIDVENFDDTIDSAFHDAIEAKSSRREFLSDPTERAYARGDERREQAHA
jgi:hypothetical protein